MSHSPSAGLPRTPARPDAEGASDASGPDPMIGQVIAGRFTVLSRLGAGAMGTVYRAKQSPIGREVAVKILRSDRALDETSRARFLREARANSLLTSPNTVTVFDFGTGEGGDFYLAMELLEGESLGQRLKRMGRLGPAAAIDTVRQALASLAEAHAKGIVHRDLKPDNLFFARCFHHGRPNEARQEIVKVLDFGIAKMLRADDELAMNAVETQAGTVFGTPRYMSPEQAQGKPLDARSDLYSLGVILYQMLTGRPPFTDDDAIVVMARHIKTVPRPMSEVAADAHIPPEIENAVMRVLSKDPANRPQTADAMSTELARARESALSVTSGVRAALVAPIERKLEPPRAELSGETLNGTKPAFARSGRRWVVPAILAGIAAVGVAFVTTSVLDRNAARAVIPQVTMAPPQADRTTADTSGTVTEPSARADVGGARSMASSAPTQASASSAASASLLASPASKLLDGHSPGPMTTHIATPGGDAHPLAASSSTSTSASTSHHHASAPPRQAGQPAPATSGSVGYGYLE